MGRRDDSSKVPTRRERERLRQRGDIISAALKLFARQGIEKTSMKQIAEEADVSVGKLYAHFRGKDDIVRDLLDEAFEDLKRKKEAACRPGDTALEQLRCKVRAGVAHFKEHVDFLIIYHNENPMSCSGKARSAIEENVEDVAKLLAQAMDDGDIPPEDPYTLAAVYIGALHEIMHLFAERRARESFDEIPRIIDRLIIEPLEMKREKDTGMEGR
jgi:TetR/AcrR family transcriptional regulator